MQINIKSNITQFTKGLNILQKKKVPYILSKSINDTLEGAKLNNTLKMHRILDRPRPQTTKAMFIIKSKVTTLTGILAYKDFANQYMKHLVEGGIRFKKNNPVPIIGAARLNKYGNITGKRSGLIKKKSQFIGEVKGVLGVWERYGARHKANNWNGQVKPIILMRLNQATYKEGTYPFFDLNKKYIMKHFSRRFKRNFRNITRGLKYK